MRKGGANVSELRDQATHLCALDVDLLVSEDIEQWVVGKWGDDEGVATWTSSATELVNSLTLEHRMAVYISAFCYLRARSRMDRIRRGYVLKDLERKVN